MGTFERYMIILSIALVVFYLAYILFLRKERNFKFLRLYLLSSLILSLALPLNHYLFTLHIPLFAENEPIIEQNIRTNQDDAEMVTGENGNIQPATIDVNPLAKPKGSLESGDLILSIYLIIFGLLIARLFVSILKIGYFYLKSPKSKLDKYTIIYLDKRIIPFSFFSFIFVDQSIPAHEQKQIIEHEKVHARQYHTIDLLFSEILIALFWFNPFVWLFKKAIQQVHEFLADEGVLQSGCGKLEYQAILVNQAAEDQLVSICSNFSYSLIKKRIMMMSKTKTPNRNGIRFLLIIPFALTGFMGVVSFSAPDKVLSGKNELSLIVPGPITRAVNLNENQDSLLKQEDKVISQVGESKDTIPGNVVAAVSPTKMNVLYLGVSNPVSIAVSGISLDRVTADIDNGTISGNNGNYQVSPKKMGLATITIYVDGKPVSKQQFRVKIVPDPVAIVNGHWNKTDMTKSELVSAGRIEAMLMNFDFDLSFEIVSFSMTIVADGFANTIKQENGKVFSPKQIELINQCKPGQKIYFEDIKAKSPDGNIRSLAPIVVTIR